MIQNGLEREKNHLSRETCLTIIQPDVFIGVFERSNKDCGDIIKYHDYVSRIPTELILRKVHFQRTNNKTNEYYCKRITDNEVALLIDFIIFENP